jgi:hypothetical protein
MSISRLALMGAAGAGGAVAVEDAFSTDLYTGNSSTQTITNGIDLAGKGGLVWLKCRSNVTNNFIHDTERNAGGIYTNSTQSQSVFNAINSYNSDGFTLNNNTGNDGNYSGFTYAAWTFRKAPKFFDVVTYTGDGQAYQSIPHSLGCPIGMLVIKRTDATSDWPTFCRTSSSGATGPINLNSTGAAIFGAAGIFFGDSLIEGQNCTFFNASHQSGMNTPNGNSTNAAGASYVAYLFAHNDADDGIIHCGSYTGNGSSSGPTITLGWEPQYLLIKRANGTGDWVIHDNARDTSNPRSAYLEPNTTNTEATGLDVDFNSAGFQIKSSATDVNTSGGTHIYMAIRAEGV